MLCTGVLSFLSTISRKSSGSCLLDELTNNSCDGRVLAECEATEDAVQLGSHR